MLTLRQDEINALASKYGLISNPITRGSDGTQTVVLERDEVNDRYCQATLHVTRNGIISCHAGLYRERAIISDGETPEDSVELAVEHAVARFNRFVVSLAEVDELTRVERDAAIVARYTKLIFALQRAWPFVHGSSDSELQRECGEILIGCGDFTEKPLAISEELNNRIYAALERSWKFVNSPFVSDPAKREVQKALELVASTVDSGADNRSQNTETPIPASATHVSDFYGRTDYYQRVDYKHLNQVSEEWQTLTRWNVWDRGSWVDAGNGFSSRRLQKIELAATQTESAETVEDQTRMRGMHP